MSQNGISHLNIEECMMGKKDIIKIENEIDIDLTALGFIDPNITINIIENDKIARKINLQLPEEVTNIVKCKNPRCISSIEQEIPHIFKLTNKNEKTYRCVYCDTAFDGKS